MLIRKPQPVQIIPVVQSLPPFKTFKAGTPFKDFVQRFKIKILLKFSRERRRYLHWVCSSFGKGYRPGSYCPEHTVNRWA